MVRFRRRHTPVGIRLVNDQSLKMNSCVHGIPLIVACAICDSSTTDKSDDFRERIEVK